VCLRALIVRRRRRGRRGFIILARRIWIDLEGPSKLLDFGNVDVADIASVSDGVLQDV
jgi:hypothetical protein